VFSNTGKNKLESLHSKSNSGKRERKGEQMADTRDIAVSIDNVNFPYLNETVDFEVTNTGYHKFVLEVKVVGCGGRGRLVCSHGRGSKTAHCVFLGIFSKVSFTITFYGYTWQDCTDEPYILVRARRLPPDATRAKFSDNFYSVAFDEGGIALPIRFR